MDRLTQFSRHFTPVHGHQARPPQFYRTLIAALLSQATNLGVVSMSASVQGLTVDMLRRVLRDFIREETLTAANAEHRQSPSCAALERPPWHWHPLVLGCPTLWDRASSLLASYYPRYFGYYEKAIGIYTHVSDQDAVFSTQVISCSPREALYVFDGLLNNDTIYRFASIPRIRMASPRLSSRSANSREMIPQVKDYAFDIVCDTSLRYKAISPDTRRIWCGYLSCLGATYRAVGHG